MRQAAHQRYARELYEDPGMQRINRLFPYWVLLGIEQIVDASARAET